MPSFIRLLILLILVVIAALITLSLALKISAFRRELGYINREILRTSGSEQEHWRRQKRRLWKSLFCFRP